MTFWQAFRPRWEEVQALLWIIIWPILLTITMLLSRPQWADAPIPHWSEERLP